MPWLYIFYIVGIANLLTYLKLKSEIKKEKNIYEMYFNVKSEPNPAKRSRTFTKYILSPKRWNDDFNPKLLFWVRLYIFISYGYILFGVIGIIVFFILASTASVQ
tara:strand:- start:1877 stop:2191 length:315 start_codon:yes stop_codon:yes gene_type:complete